MTKFGKLQGDYASIALEALRPLFATADCERISDIYFSSFAPTELCEIDDPCLAISAALRGEYPSFRPEFHGPFKTGGEALYRALTEFHAREAFSRSSETDRGSDREILLLACEKMTHIDAGKASLLLSNRVNPHDRTYGATLPALGALVARSYMSRYRVPYRAFHRVSVKNHLNAMLNPKAHFHREIEEADVAASPTVSDPLRRLHCAPTSDGAVAVLLSREEGDICFRAWVEGLDAPLFQERENLARLRATAEASRQAYAQSRTSPRDVNIVETHDAFSPLELINLEEMGFYPLGDAWRAMDEGELDINGRIAVNPSGGMKARGHPIGACGLSSIVEVYEQLAHTAGKRQHEAASLAMVQSAGGVSRHSYVFIIDTLV